MKIFKWILRVFLLLVLLVGVAVGVVIYELSDNSFNEPEYLKNYEPVEFDLNNFVSKGLKDTKEEGTMELTMDEKEINYLLKSISLDLNSKLQGALKFNSMYIETEDGHDIKFITYLDAAGFKTSLKGDFNIELINNNFMIEIDNIKIGKLNFDKEKVVSIINKVTNGQSLAQELDLMGIKLHSDLSKLSASLNLLDLKDSILKSIGDENDSKLYKTMMDIFFRVEEIVKLNENGHELGIDINLNAFSYNKETDAAKPYLMDFDGVNSKVETLLNNNVINVEDVNNVATYLVRGIYSSEEVKNSVKELDLSSVGINDLSTYKGIINISDNEIEDIFATQIPTSLEEIMSFDGFVFHESDWNNLLLKSDAIGQMYNFVRKEDNVYKNSYIALESLYMDIIDNHYSMNLLLNINGRSLVMSIAADSNEADGLFMESKVTSMRFGSNELLDSEIKTLLNFIDNSLNDEWIKINPDNLTLDFDFSMVFDGNTELKDFATTYGDIKTSFKEDSGNGYTLIGFDLGL